MLDLRHLVCYNPLKILRGGRLCYQKFVPTVMFFQDPSLLAFQKCMQDSIQHNNLTTVYDVIKIPKESQIREVLDRVDPSDLAPIFSVIGDIL